MQKESIRLMEKKFGQELKNYKCLDLGKHDYFKE